MRIAKFTIRNYRSIKDLTIDNPSSINVFFGKNNVGKSNILRALHLAFYGFNSDRIYLPDTMFYNRDIYRPIEVVIDLVLEEDFFNLNKMNEALLESMEDIASVISKEKEIFKNSEKEIIDFIEMLKSFLLLREFRLEVNMQYNEEVADLKCLIEDVKSDYRFDFGECKSLYRTLERAIEREIMSEKKKIIESMTSELSEIGTELPEELLRRIEYGPKDVISLLEIGIGYYSRRIEDEKTKEQYNLLLKRTKERFHELDSSELPKSLERSFIIVREYFRRISENFILIPNREYFHKSPFIVGRNNEKTELEIFDIDKFEKKLLSLIESPNIKERELIRRFNDIFGKSYSDLGELEIRKFREKVFAIFDTGFTSLPIESQGIGVQDLFLFLTHMILFGSAIIAIEEPEGGLSTENQRILHNLVEKIYLGTDKQIFISSHSEEFETPNSYVIEIDSNGTKEISRMEREGDYEERIENVLIKRKLEEENREYEALLREVAERQITLDILNYIGSLIDTRNVDPEKISKELGYKKEKIEEILGELGGKGK